MDRNVLQKGRKDAGLLVGWKEHAPQDGARTGLFPKDGKYYKPIVDDGNGHLMTIAPTRSGKGRGCIIPNLLVYPGPAIIVDPKGENYAVTARFRRETLGQKIILLDPFGITGDTSNFFNPLDMMQVKETEDQNGQHPRREIQYKRGMAYSTQVDDAYSLASLIVDKNPRINDPFWDNMATSLIAGLVLHVASESPKALRNLGEVLYLLNQDKNDWQFTEKEMANNKICGPTISLLSGAALKAEPKVRASIISTAQSKLGFMATPSVQQVSARSDFSLNDVYLGVPMTIYLVIPPDKLKSHGPLLRLWLHCFMTAIMKRQGAPDRSTLFILDEAAQLGPLDALRTITTLAAGYGVRLWSFWQDITQIQHAYPNDWPALLNNTKTKQLFGFARSKMITEGTALFGSLAMAGLYKFQSDDALLSMADENIRASHLPDYLSDTPFLGRYNVNPYYGSLSKELPFAGKESCKTETGEEMAIQIEKQNFLYWDKPLNHKKLNPDNIIPFLPEHFSRSR